MLLHASLLATRAPWPVVGAALLLAMALLAGAARSGAAETVAEEIGRAETRFAAALGGDWRDLEYLLADDFVYNTAEGTTLGKGALIGYLRSASVQVLRVELEQRRVREYGRVAVSSGVARVVAQSGAVQRAIDSRFLHVWSREGDAWKLVARQVTYMKPAPGARSEISVAMPSRARIASGGKPPAQTMTASLASSK